jgi:hypothetical protein
LLLINITDGPTKEELIKAFADRTRVVMTLNGNKKEQKVINTLQHEDGSGYSFNFVTMDGVNGYYDTRKRQGIINSQKK